MRTIDIQVDVLLFVALVARAGIRVNIAIARGWLTEACYETIPVARLIKRGARV